MSTEICRSAFGRNVTVISPSKHSNVSEIQWITNILSLLISVVAFFGNTIALRIMFTFRGQTKSTHDKYLINLAVADLLRACFIPFTAIARIKRNFIFGKLICQLLPIIQGNEWIESVTLHCTEWFSLGKGVGVSVDAFTLVCISIERYLAICRPFLLLKLQSIRFSSQLNSLVSILIWTFGFLTALPNFYMHNLCFLPTLQRLKCEKIPLESLDERIYMIVLDVLYFILPLTMMIILHVLIMLKMSEKNVAMRMRSLQSSTRKRENPEYHLPVLQQFDSVNSRHLQLIPALSIDSQRDSGRFSGFMFLKTRPEDSLSIMRMDRHRRKALKILIILIVEFFICWTPLYMYHTIGTFHKGFYRSIPSIILDVSLLFSFTSALCNPLTYYFMSKRYRSALFESFTTCRRNVTGSR